MQNGKDGESIRELEEDKWREILWLSREKRLNILKKEQVSGHL